MVLEAALADVTDPATSASAENATKTLINTDFFMELPLLSVFLRSNLFTHEIPNPWLGEGLAPIRVSPYSHFRKVRGIREVFSDVRDSYARSSRTRGITCVA